MLVGWFLCVAFGGGSAITFVCFEGKGEERGGFCEIDRHRSVFFPGLEAAGGKEEKGDQGYGAAVEGMKGMDRNGIRRLQ